MAGPQTYAALLRGINVGGRNAVSMGELRRLVEGLGHEEVVTYIQSGNLVFRGPGTPPTITRELEAAIEQAFGLKITVILRSAAELLEIVAANPFPGRETEPAKLHVVFLAAAPPADGVAGLDPDRSPGDELAVVGREIYLSLPNGAGQTKLTLDYLERRLGVPGTARNWNTLLKLVTLSG